MDFENLKADLVSQPITGFIQRHGEYHKINIPLISHVVDNLYVGGHNHEVNLGDFFSHVFSLYIWDGPYNTDESTVHVELKMYDGTHVDVEGVEEMVPKILEALETGGNVLVHCQAGINRSNLVATRVLMEWKGLTAREAIALLRDKRDEAVLSNRKFENYLKSLDKVNG